MTVLSNNLGGADMLQVAPQQDSHDEQPQKKGWVPSEDIMSIWDFIFFWHFVIHMLVELQYAPLLPDRRYSCTAGTLPSNVCLQ
jgi:hypothetical protein